MYIKGNILKEKDWICSSCLRKRWHWLKSFYFKKNVTGPGKNCETCNFGNARNYCNIHNYNQLLFVHQMEFHDRVNPLSTVKTVPLPVNRLTHWNEPETTAFTVWSANNEPSCVQYVQYSTICFWTFQTFSNLRKLSLYVWISIFFLLQCTYRVYPEEELKLVV